MKSKTASSQFRLVKMPFLFNIPKVVKYRLKTMGFYGKRDLNRMIVSTDVQEKMELFKKVRLSFIQAINRETTRQPERAVP